MSIGDIASAFMICFLFIVVVQSFIVWIKSKNKENTNQKTTKNSNEKEQSKVTKNNQKLPKTMIWGFVLIGAQIIYNAMLMVKLDTRIGYAIGYTIGTHILTIIAVILFYKAYKNKQ